MNSPTAQFVSLRRMGLYEPVHQMGMWGDFMGGYPNTPALMVEDVSTKMINNQSEDTTSQGSLGPSNQFDQEATKPPDKVLRRLAQNREAARKSRLRKKAYVQQLETSRLKLITLEQELEQARQQGLYASGGLDNSPLVYSGAVNPGIAAFEIEYGHWVAEQNKRTCQLRTALSSHVDDAKIKVLVDDSMKHYSDLFRMKATAAKADVFYIISGMFNTSAERFFLWIGGFRPSELLQLDLLMDQQLVDARNLTQSCQQAEDALSQGMDKLQLTLVNTVAAGQLGEGSYNAHVATTMEKLDALVSFVMQADHLRQETLLQMARILTIRQAARALLALGEYFHRLRTLSSLWANHHREPT